MLAEILMVRLETTLRMAKEVPPPRDPRFVPFTMAGRSEFKTVAPAPGAPDAPAAMTEAAP
jgi:hypothetical protein